MKNITRHLSASRVVAVLALAFALAAVVVLGTREALASGATFTTIDFPGAVYTLATDINKTGEIVGRYIDTAGINHGFLLSNGSFSSIDFPGATGFTRALGINSGGDIVGDYFIGNVEHGYLLSGGAFTKIDFPGADDTQPVGINTGGDIVGHYTESNGNGDTKTHGFLLRAGNFSSIDIPGATYTEAWRINDNGQIAGRFKGGDGKFHVYVLTNGSFTTIDFPGAVQTAPGGFSHLGGLNDNGDVASTYCSSTPCGVGLNSAGDVHGFLLSGGVFTAIDFPGALITVGFGLNDSDDVVGGYKDSNGRVHGYLRTP
jgi:uncharacterized membrane protein